MEKIKTNDKNAISSMESIFKLVPKLILNLFIEYKLYNQVTFYRPVEQNVNLVPVFHWTDMYWFTRVVGARGQNIEISKFPYVDFNHTQSPVTTRFEVKIPVLT